MSTATDAGILAGCCAVVWLAIAPVAARTGWWVRFLLSLGGAGATTVAAVAIGRWRQHVRPTAAGVAITFGGMCVFWTLTALQRRGRAGAPEVTDPGPAVAGPQPVPSSTASSLTRRERRMAGRRRFPVPYRRRGARVDA
jgi:hypothetical protein